MILKNPYDSELQRLVNLKDTVKNINVYITLSYAFIQTQEQNKSIKLKPFEGESRTLNPVSLYGISQEERDVPAFAHPLINTQNNWIAMDFRPYVTPDVSNNTFGVRNKTEFDLQFNRFILSGMFATGKEGVLYGLKYPHMVFSEWLSDSLTHRFGLGMADQFKLRVLSALYYVTLFRNGPLERDDLDKFIIRAKEEAMLPELIREVFAIAKGMESLDDFANMCYQVTQNVRLQKLDSTVLINIFSNSWSGSAAKEMSILALEHPPTFISLVYAALMDRSFKRSTIATVTERRNKRGAGAEFISAVNGILEARRESGKVDYTW